ncbi:hypothetical protein [Lutibacter sp.]|uniref:hypothetical protein n=1 Tax=Lutibacter sp. TaxID=1925666 RepID=UPI0034A09CF4
MKERLEKLKKEIFEQEIKEVAMIIGDLKESRASKEEQYFNPIGCVKYDAFLAGVKWMEEKINNLQNESK